MSVEMPAQFSHHVKIEETAQGIRIHVSAYAKTETEAVASAFGLYKKSIAEADGEGYLRAPMEIKEIKKK